MDELNRHANSIGSNKIIVSGSEKKLTETELKTEKCSKCGKPAIYRSNFIGTEKLLCEKDGEKFLQKNSDLPRDFWYLKSLNK
jgi:hypothetical protein